MVRVEDDDIIGRITYKGHGFFDKRCYDQHPSVAVTHGLQRIGANNFSQVAVFEGSGVRPFNLDNLDRRMELYDA